MSSAASSNLTVLVNIRGCFSPQIFHCKMYNDSILKKQGFLNMRVINVCHKNGIHRQETIPDTPVVLKEYI